MLDFNLNPELSLHYHNESGNRSNLPPIEKIVGSGNGWTKEVVGNVYVKSTPGRTTLDLQGSGAMKINGSLVIGG